MLTQTLVAASIALISNVAALAPGAGGYVGAQSPAAGQTVHVVQVGGSNASLTFTPNNVQAAVGDIVQFQFNPKNHSVVQAAFSNPCTPIQDIMSNKTDAFFSGFMPTASANGSKLVYSVAVTSDQPVWYYCSQAKHCQQGMVGAINAKTTGERTIERFTLMAASAAENLSPGHSSGTPGAASPTGGVPGGNAPGAPSPTSGNLPAQQTVNAAPGLTSAKSGLFAVVLTGLAAFLTL